ncbi:MAG: methyltransferase [Verrucomicrobiota bacterium]|jgi:3-oxo-5-alpha-steroid 4-dehydrogenase 1|nr:methyltransferase [Verrucomicrobiota bacterium]
MPPASSMITPYPEWLSTFTWTWIALAMPVAISLCFFNAPYGRHNPGIWRPMIRARTGWLLMESPAVVLPAGAFVWGCGWESPMLLLFFLLWQLHYVYRAWIYPFRLAKTSSPIPLPLILMGMAFNLTNGLLHSVWLFVQPTMIGTDWLTDWRFAMGVAFFGLGFAVNVDSCNRLLRLRRENQDDYSIPRGGLFRWVSCPNYLGEMVEWIGWALLTWNPAGLAFAVWTMANLAPRARAHHYWYRDRFPDYPTKRKALIPGIF